MSPPNETGAPERTPAKSVTTTAPPQATRPTQIQRVLRLLLDNESVCGSQFLNRYLPRYSARIYELRNQGFVIYTRQCRRPEHRHLSTAWQYELVALPYPIGEGRPR